jgi:ArsR family transcriptional regulator
MKDFLKVMKALSDPGRVKIVKMLGERDALCVCEITAVLELAQSTVSKHLKILEEAGLVAYDKEGSWVNYHLAQGADNLYAQAMLVHLDEWFGKEPELQNMAVRVKAVDRQKIKNG